MGNWDQPRPYDSATSARLAQYDAAGSAGAETQEALTSVALTYDLWQWGLSALSGLGPISPIQGRREVQLNAVIIRRVAQDDLQLIVAASIAHQASDFKDRPFGTDALEEVWSELIDDNISVGIAQLRPAEIRQWAPFLPNADLLAPEVAIRVMAGKLRQANAYILQTNSQVSVTDRYMLLALAQNASAFSSIRTMVDRFFAVAGSDWSTMLAGDLAEDWDWREQLRLVLVHVDWLIEQGWQTPEGFDRDYWARIAFSEP